MAQLSLSVGMWRMVRLAERKKRFRFEDTRSMARRDRGDFDWLVANGFFAPAGDGWYVVTPKGVIAGDMGYYEWEPPKRTAPPPPPPAVPTPKRKGKK